MTRDVRIPVLLFSLWGVLAPLPRLLAQGVEPQTQLRLDHTVHLSLGRTTLKQALRELSRQTGVIIEEAPYLSQREVVVELGDVSGSGGLDALLLVNDLKFYEDSPNHLTVERPVPAPPKVPADIPKCVAAVLPKDIRNFTLFGVPQETGLKLMGKSNTSKYIDALYSGYVDRWRDDRIAARRDALRVSLGDVFSKKQKPLFAELNADQQTQILAYLLCDRFASRDFHTLQATPPPYVADVMKASIWLNEGDFLFIGAETRNGTLRTSRFFGTQVHPTKSPASEPDKQP